MLVADLICESHRQEILDTLLWPNGLQPGNDCACHDCRRISRAQRAGYYPQFPADAPLRQWIAWHEAGHVVVNLQVGNHVQFAELTEGENLDGLVRYNTTDATIADAASIAGWAGMLAQRERMRQDGPLSVLLVIGAAYSALRDAEDIFTATGGSRWQIERDRVSAQDLVTQHWDDIDRVAQALHDRGRLDATDIGQLVSIPVPA